MRYRGILEGMKGEPMSDLISRNLCNSCINNECIFQYGIVRNYCDFYKAESEDKSMDTIIDNAPTIEAEPVIHAKWIFRPDDSECACTNCNFKIYGTLYQNRYLIVPYNFCPNCGAKMDGGKSDG